MAGLRRKWAYKLGFTTDYRTELSKDIIQKDAIVFKKEHKDSSMGYVGVFVSIPEYNRVAFRIPSSTFGSEYLHFVVDDKKIFDNVSEGEVIILSYAKNYSIKSDYVPPNFEEKVDFEPEFLEDVLQAIDSENFNFNFKRGVINKRNPDSREFELFSYLNSDLTNLYSSKRPLTGFYGDDMDLSRIYRVHIE